MQWIRKRLLEILCVMIYFTVNLLSTSGLRPLSQIVEALKKIIKLATGLHRVKRR